jgi:hypothetical protein
VRVKMALGLLLTTALFACGGDAEPGGAPSAQRSRSSHDHDVLEVLHAFASGEIDGPSVERMRRLDASPLAPVLCLLDLLPPGFTSCQEQIRVEG